MLKHSKITTYKLKKILTMFTEDFCATDTAKTVKLNRNTINKYYKLFRKTIKLLLVELLWQQNDPVEYIGYMKDDYGPKKFLNVYKYAKNLYLFSVIEEKPNHRKYAMNHKEAKYFLEFINNRFTKFYGFSKETYLDQLIESSIRYYYTKEELFEKIYSKIKLPIENVY